MSTKRSDRTPDGAGSPPPFAAPDHDLLQRLMEDVHGHALVRLDAGGAISGWGPAAQERYGYPADEILGQSYSRLYSPEDIGLGLPEVDLADAAANDRFSATRVRRRSDGSVQPARISLHALRSATGRLHGFLELSAPAETAPAPGATTPGASSYACLFTNNPDAVLSVSRSGIVSDANRPAESLYGTDRSRLVGRPLATLMEASAPGSLEAAFERALRGEAGEVECQLRRADDSVVSLGVTLIPDGPVHRVRGVFAVARDVTDRTRWEGDQRGLIEQLGAERARLAAVVRQMPAGVVIAEAPTGRIVLGNDQIERILKHPLIPTQDVAGYAEWRGFRPDGRRMEPDDWPLTRAIRYGETITGEELEYLRGDGARTWIRVHASPIRDARGRIVAGVAIFDEIEEEKRAEAGMRFLTEASSVLTTSLDYRKMLKRLAHLAVPRFADWCVFDMVSIEGVAHRRETAHSDPSKETVLRYLHRRFRVDYDSESHPIGRVFRRGEPTLVEEVSPELLDEIASDAEHRRLLEQLDVRSLVVVPLQGRQRVLGVMIFGLGESGRHYRTQDMELALELARRSTAALENAELFAAASAASEAKSNFLAVVSHELRTPLNAIMGYTELLLMGVPDPIPDSAVRQTQRIRYSAEHLRAIVEEILTFTRVESGTERVHLQAADLRRVLDEAAAGVRRPATEKGLELVVVAPESPWMVETDAGKVKRILTHLLSNAVKFTEVGRIELTGHAGGELLVLEVRDTGVGIENRHLEQIFEPFWQIDSSRTRRYEGTGLGLSVARQLARLLGGDVSVTSQLGAGTSFRVTLPLAVP
jgi:PAS domain S-box-containing protein